MHRPSPPRILFTALFALLSFHAAHAASFNCSKAETPREKAVCANPELSSLDDKLDAAYKSTIATLSSSGAALVQSDQRDWLHWLSQVCPPTNSRGDDLATCLTNHYYDRLAQLTAGSRKLDGLTLYARARFLFVPARQKLSKSEASFNPGYGYGSFAWPQIDNPTPAQQAWNEAVFAAVLKSSCCIADAHPIETLDEAVDEDSYVFGFYTLTAANTRFIDVNLGTSTYGWGAAHPNTGIVNFGWWLDLCRPLQAEDVFAPSSGWHEKLAALVFTKLQKDPGPDSLWTTDSGTTPRQLMDEITAGAIRPDAWDISSTGLTITYGSYAIGPYSSGMPTATLTWDELTPLLSPTLHPETLPTPIPST